MGVVMVKVLGLYSFDKLFDWIVLLYWLITVVYPIQYAMEVTPWRPLYCSLLKMISMLIIDILVL